MEDESYETGTLFLKMPLFIILFTLYDKGELDLTSLSYESRLCRQTIYTNIKTLIAFGLIEERKIRALPSRRLVCLTALGKEIVVLMHKIMSENRREYTPNTKRKAKQASSKFDNRLYGSVDK